MKTLSHFAVRSACLAALVVLMLLSLLAQAKDKYRVLYTFTGKADGGAPIGRLAFDKAGNLYGTAVGGGTGCSFGCGVVFQLTPRQNEWKESVLYNFQNAGSDGWAPYSGITMDSSGHLYGTTRSGGTHRLGTIFELSLSSHGWEAQQLYSFGTNPNDGAQPTTLLTMDSSRNLYGTTWVGGKYDGGTVFKMTPGTHKDDVLEQFCPNDCAGGRTPLASVILDASGNIYGTTAGAGGLYPPDGVVFELTHAPNGPWTEHVLHTFGKYSGDGQVPSGPVVFDGPDTLYTTTAGGGENKCGPTGNAGCGTVVQMTRRSDGHWDERVIHRFAPGQGGFYPNSSVVLDRNGNLYGTTLLGGIKSGYCEFGCGTIYRLSPQKGGTWKYQLLHIFMGQSADGSIGGLLIDAKGNLYGTAESDGFFGNGAVFEVTP